MRPLLSSHQHTAWQSAIFHVFQWIHAVTGCAVWWTQCQAHEKASIMELGRVKSANSSLCESATLFFTFFVLRVHHKVPLWKTEEDCASEVNEKYTQKRERRAIESARKKIFKMSRNKNSFTIGNRLRVLQRERERAREIFHHHNSRQLYFIYKHCSVFALFTLSIDGPLCAVWGGRGGGRWNENFTNHENEIIDRSS